jgi:hypothetical protein
VRECWIGGVVCSGCLPGVAGCAALVSGPRQSQQGTEMQTGTNSKGSKRKQLKDQEQEP